MWRNWNPLNPPINEQSSDEDNNFESPPENQPNPSELVSPRRPHQSASASPRALLRPDPLPVQEVLEQVDQRLRNLPNREQRVANRAAHREAQEAAQAAAEAAAAARQPVMPPQIVDFEDENGVDDPAALQNACRNLERFTWDQSDIKFTFQKMEIKMAAVGVKKQYTKFQVLSTVIPKVVEDEVKPILTKKETEFPNADAYRVLKKRILEIFGPRLEESISRALGRVLVGQPSQLARALVNDICKEDELCKCCAAVISTLWKRQLPSNVNSGIARYPFNKENLDEILKLADDIYSSNQPKASLAAYTVAAVADATHSVLDETQPGLPYPVVQEVSAVRGFRGGGRGGRGWRGGRNNRGNNRGGQNQQQSSGASANPTPKHKGTKHPDLPAGD